MADVLSQDMLTNGYDGWLRIVQWNPTAIYGNFEAIVYALCYPRMPMEIGYNIGAITFDSGNSDNAVIDAIVNGNSIDNRWYLPAVAELQQIYSVLNELPNGFGQTLRGLEFWSVNVDSVTDTSAMSVMFDTASSTVTAKDKASERLYVLPAREFSYNGSIVQ